jgi:selenocysteine lyase/cysteine desulfurase
VATQLPREVVMQSRRSFLGGLALPAVAGAGFHSALLEPRALSIAASLAGHPGTPREIAQDEDFWAEVGRCFTVDRSVVHFNNGGVCPSPAFVQEAVRRNQAFADSWITSLALFTDLPQQVEAVRQRVALHWGVSPEEIAFTRNSSEALQICQFGIDLKNGDEVLTTDQDYPRMRNTFRQRELREGITLRLFPIPVPGEDVDQIVSLFEEQITPATKLILMSHMINLTGQILPVKEVTAMARGHGIPVIVDGAHSFAHFPFKLTDLDCDYFGTSLHKWLFAPHGTGLLYVRREKIKDLWPMMAAPEGKEDDIRKFEEIGTHAVGLKVAIGEALTFHQNLGDERKAERLRTLRDAWASRLTAASDRFILHTSLKRQFSCGLATVGIDGIEPEALQQWLWDEHKIFTTPIKTEQFAGIRVTPSLYSTMEEIDRFCLAMEHAAKNGLPA